MSIVNRPRPVWPFSVSQLPHLLKPLNLILIVIIIAYNTIGYSICIQALQQICWHFAESNRQQSILHFALNRVMGAYDVMQFIVIEDSALWSIPIA